MRMDRVPKGVNVSAGLSLDDVVPVRRRRKKASRRQVAQMGRQMAKLMQAAKNAAGAGGTTIFDAAKNIQAEPVTITTESGDSDE